MQSDDCATKIQLKNQFPDKPEHTLIHISDTHLLGDDHKLYDSSVDSYSNIVRLFDQLEKSNQTPDAIIFTGDIADQGEAKAYRKIFEIAEPLAKKMNTQLIWVMGNHDNRMNFRINLLDEFPSEETIDAVYMLNGLRVINLDTSVIGHHYGEVSDEQLNWLEDVLRTPAPHGTILAMHHPPIPSVLPLATVVELQDQQKLAAVLKNSDVRSIIAGHLHYSSFSTFAGIPVSVASASCYTQDLTVEKGGTRGRDGAQGYNIVNVYEDIILHSVVPIGETLSVGRVYTADESTQVLTDEGLIKQVIV